MPLEKEFPTYLNEGIRDHIFNWLLKARYWLGVMVGMSGKNFEISCRELQFLWYIDRGVRVYISPIGEHSRYKELFMKISSSFSSQVFEYRLPKRKSELLDSAFLEVVHEVEYLIENFFPGIQCTNTWAICNVIESDDCSGKDGYISICDVVGEEKICERCLNSRKEKVAKGYDGFVYLIGNHEQRIYKIGLSRQPKDRYKAFATKLPFKVEILHQINATNMKRAEKLLHKWMKNKNAYGEWFHLSEKDVDFICKLVSFEKDNFIDNSGSTIQEYEN